MEIFISCHRYLERQPMPCKTRMHGFSASSNKTFCFCNECLTNAQLEGKKFFIDCIHFRVHSSPQYKRDVDRTERVEHKAATMSGSGSSALQEREAFMGAWLWASTSWQTVRKGAGPQATVRTEVRVVLPRCKDSVFF